MQERRQFVRLDAHVGVKYWVLASEQPETTHTKDIGGGGVRLVVERALKQHTPLSVELMLPGRSKPVSFIGEVVWCESPSSASGHPPHFEVGVQFLKIDPRGQQMLIQYVAQEKKPSTSP